MLVHREFESDIISPERQMSYSLQSNYKDVHYPQKHDFFEMTLLLKGRQRVTVSGKSAIVGEGSLVLIRPGEVHSRQYLEGGQHINIAFSSQVAEEMFDFLGEGYPSRQLLCSAAPLYVILNRYQAEHYRARFDSINTIPLQEAERSRTLLRVLLVDLFTHVFVRTESESKGSSSDWLDCLIEGTRTPDVLLGGVDEMVRRSRKSHEHFCRVFRKRMKMTPTEYVNDLRLSYAADRLLHSADSIADICFSSGFEGLSYFYHLFRKKYGCAPGAFRDAQRLGPQQEEAT